MPAQAPGTSLSAEVTEATLHASSAVAAPNDGVAGQSIGDTGGAGHVMTGGVISLTTTD